MALSGLPKFSTASLFRNKDNTLKSAEEADFIVVIAASNPDVVASASLATCNNNAVVKTLETAKRVVSKALTVTGG